MKDGLPYVIAFVLTFAFVLLLVAFRSLVVPIKAIVLNLLSVGAAYGVLVLVFQHHWAQGLLGFQSNGTIISWLPLFLFVILFGLSMDYHVFILSRVREGVDHGMTNDAAVRHGISVTAGVVTSAALVMVGVFSLFGTALLARAQAGGRRARGRRADRRHDRPRRAPAGVDEAPRRLELVPPRARSRSSTTRIPTCAASDARVPCVLRETGRRCGVFQSGRRDWDSGPVYVPPVLPIAWSEPVLMPDCSEHQGLDGQPWSIKSDTKSDNDQDGPSGQWNAIGSVPQPTPQLDQVMASVECRPLRTKIPKEHACGVYSPLPRWRWHWSRSESLSAALLWRAPG